MTQIIECPAIPQRTDDREVKDHYDRLLSRIYWWMLGGVETSLERSRAELAGLGFTAVTGPARALDLGAGPGLQSIPLAELGYRVTAIDTSVDLLRDLARRRPDVATYALDLRDLPPELGDAYEVVVCMGDTITHLGGTGEVDLVLGAGARLLAPGGVFVLTFRDYVSSVRSAADRFILVRGDEERILTCCLEYQPERVRVTDILHERHDGAWSLTASSYDKLRLSPWWVSERLAKRGLSVARDVGPTGMTRIVARRPSA
jgi:SAM-dependent methyltransferase